MQVLHCEVNVNLFACQYLLQFSAAEVAQSAVADGRVEHLDVSVVFLAEQRSTTLRCSAEDNLVVLIVSLLQQYSCTVRQSELFVAELSVLFLALDAAFFGQNAYQRLVLNVVNPCCELLSVNAVDGLLDRFSCRIFSTFLLCVECHYNCVGVSFAYQLLGDLVDSFNRDNRRNLLHYLILVFD